ncbi:MAG: C40 family peptidase [Bacteroidia bacterium]
MSSCRTHKETSSSTEHKKISASKTKNIQSKYAAILHVDESKIDNVKLYSFIDEWYGVPYKYGGNNKKGIDCSNFASTLYSTVYLKPLTGSSSSIFTQCKVVSKNNLEEGDLVFFKIDGDNISHIGVYLQNNKFVHATTKKGVMVDDLDEDYYKKYYYKGGRIK